MELKQYTALLWRWKWLILLATFLAAGAAYGTSRLQQPIYRATTTLLVNQAPSEQVNDYTAILTSERLARTYAEMFTNRPVLEEVIARLGGPTTPEDMAETIDVQLVRDTQLITVSVEHPSPAWAAAIANEVVNVFAAQNEAMQESRYAASKEALSQELERLRAQVEETEQAIAHLGTPTTETGREQMARLQSDLTQYRSSYASVLQSFEELRLAEARSVSNVVQVESAVEPAKPVRPRTLVNTLLAAVVGAMLAVGAVFLIEYLDDTIKTPDELMRATELPIVGLIARMDDETEGEPYAAQHPRSPAAEAFRSLRTNLQFSSVDRPLRTLLVTSSGPREGKSTVAANLAVVMAQGGHRVTLLDADLRRPRLHRLLGVPNRVGMSDLFTRNPLDFNGALRGWRMDNMALLTSGGLPPNPAELLSSERMTQILDQVVQRSDFVIIDSPPAGAVTDATLLAARVDGVLLVIEPKRTRLPSAVQVVQQLRRAGANVVGLVFNNIPLGRSGYYNGYYSGYYYQYVYPYGEDGREGRQPQRRRVRVKKPSRA